MPMESPTMSNIRVTSSAMATILISDRIGRCTRFATIIRFIMMSVEGRNPLPAISSLRRRSLRLVEAHYFGSRRLFQGELIIGKRFVHLQLHHGERDAVFLLRAIDLDLVWEIYSAEIGRASCRERV